MPRLQLCIYIDPGSSEIFCNILCKDGSYERLTAIIDTGAEVSLFPDDLLDLVEYDEQAKIIVQQAGISKQAFEATEGYVTITLEDQNGQITSPFKIPIWFTRTPKALIGFAGVLDRAVLHIDMPKREGWLEIDVP